MEYSAVNAASSRSAGKFISGGQAIGSAQGLVAAVPVPTVASALGRMDHLNERLAQISIQLGQIAVTIGGPYPANGISKDQPAPNTMVQRLNDGADAAHRQVGEIEELIGAISRALG